MLRIICKIAKQRRLWKSSINPTTLDSDCQGPQWNLIVNILNFNSSLKCLLYILQYAHLRILCMIRRTLQSDLQLRIKPSSKEGDSSLLVMLTLHLVSILNSASVSHWYSSTFNTIDKTSSNFFGDHLTFIKYLPWSRLCSLQFGFNNAKKKKIERFGVSSFLLL